MSLHQYVRHPWREQRERRGPVRVADQLPAGTPAARFNARLAVAITRVVGSMWCAYAFGLFDLISLPAAIRGGSASLVAWIAQTFLQLVLLSVIMVGQNVQGAAADKRAEATFNDAEAILHGLDQHAAHLAAQDVLLQSLAAQLADALGAVPPRT